MGPASPQIHPRSRTRTHLHTFEPGSLLAYSNLLDEDRPALIVVRKSPIDFGPATLLSFRQNRQLLFLLKKKPGDRLLWSPIWWKDDADPYGRIILWRDPPRGRQRGHAIRNKGRETVSISLSGHRNAQLWFPVPTITHYAITQFTPLLHGLVFNPLDGFQRTKSIDSDSSYLNGIPGVPSLPASPVALPEVADSPKSQTSSDDSTHPND